MQNITSNDVRSTDYYIYNLKHKPIQDLLIMEIKNEIEYGRIGEPPTIIDKHGNRQWQRDGKCHRERDLPSMIYIDGSKEWCVNGRYHRDTDLPSVIYHPNGEGFMAWYKHGKTHRDGDLPAVVNSTGYKAWYRNNSHYRDGGLPAVIRANGDEEWYTNGKRIVKQDYFKIFIIWCLVINLLFWLVIIIKSIYKSN